MAAAFVYTDIIYVIIEDEMENEMIISERIFALMQEKGISQKELSEKTGISQSTISDWKRKKTNPSSDKLMAICDVLQITLYDLLGDGIRRPVDYLVVDRQSDDYFFLMEYHSLSTAYKERLAGYMRALQDLGGPKGKPID